MCFVLTFYSVVRLFDIAAEQEVIQTVNKNHSSDHDDSVSLSFFHVPFTLLTGGVAASVQRKIKNQWLI